jgi:hypothetical protein
VNQADCLCSSKAAAAPALALEDLLDSLPTEITKVRIRVFRNQSVCLCGAKAAAAAESLEDLLDSLPSEVTKVRVPPGMVWLLFWSNGSSSSRVAEGPAGQPAL